MTHTYAILDISAEAYKEIKERLLAVNYGHVIIKDDDREVIDMHGIALRTENDGNVRCYLVHDGKLVPKNEPNTVR